MIYPRGIRSDRKNTLIQWTALPILAFFVISFARKDAGEYPPEWDKKNKDAFEKVEKEKQEGKKPKPSDKARHDIYKKKLDREKRRKHERS